MNKTGKIQDRSAMDLFRLDNRVAFVSGGTGHLGKHMVHALAQAGGIVYVNGRNAQSVEKVVKEFQDQDLKVHGAAFDITDSDAVEAGCQQLIENEGRLDILINSAYSGKTGTLDDSTPESYNGAYELTVTATARLMQAFEPAMLNAVEQQGHASVSNIASRYGRGSPDPSL